MSDFSLELNRLKVGIVEHFRLDENEQRVEAANTYPSYHGRMIRLTTYPVFLEISVIRQLCSFFREKSRNDVI